MAKSVMQMLKESPEGGVLLKPRKNFVSDGQKLGDNEAQGNQKPLTSEEIVKDQENVTTPTQTVSAAERAFQRDNASATPSIAQKLSNKYDVAKKATGNFLDKFTTENPNALKYGIGAAALGGLGYAAYKKLKNDRAAKKANAKMIA